MSAGEKKLPLLAGIFLMIFGGIIDLTQFVLDLILGIGFLLDPLFFTPIAWIVFGITLAACGMPMFSGKRAWAGWVTLVFEFVPGIDGIVPGWFLYAAYLTFGSRLKSVARDIMGI